MKLIVSQIIMSEANLTASKLFKLDSIYTKMVLKKISKNVYEIPKEGKMNVPDEHKVFIL